MNLVYRQHRSNNKSTSVFNGIDKAAYSMCLIINWYNEREEGEMKTSENLHKEGYNWHFMAKHITDLKLTLYRN